MWISIGRKIKLIFGDFFNKRVKKLFKKIVIICRLKIVYLKSFSFSVTFLRKKGNSIDFQVDRRISYNT